MNTSLIRRTVSLMFTVSLMALIFFFSSQNGIASGQTSNGFIKHLAELFVRSFRSLSPEEKFEYAERFQAVVRSLAHFSLYALFGFSVSVTGLSFGLKRFKVYAAEALFCLLYAVSDEIHQHFVPGRSAELTDVVIDTAGAVVGIAAFVIVCRFCLFIKRRRKNDPSSDTL